MRELLKSRPVSPMFVGVFGVSLVVAVGLNIWTPLREAGTILLFVPLIWSFMSRSLRGMVVCGVVLTLTRMALEALHLRRAEGAVNLVAVVRESIFPIGLYVALGATFYLYRIRQQRLFDRLMASESREAMSQLAGGLAHDFNNILSVIMGTGQLLNMNPSLNDEAHSDVNAILKAGEQATALVQEMMNFARRAVSPRQQRDLTQVVAEQLTMIQRSMPKTVVTVREFADEPLPVNIDVAKIDRCLTNLCKNAREAMPEGGTLTVRTARVDDPSGAWALLSVRDTGKGIDPKFQSRLFAPFFTTRANGTGLGLTVVKGIADDHRGRVLVDSPPGQGATFTVMLPLDKGAP